MKAAQCLAVIVGFLTTVNANAGNPEFLDFVMKNVHDKQFYGCDTAVRDKFENVAGENIRVSAGKFPGIADLLTVTATWGDPGDTVLSTWTFMKVGRQCLAIGSSVLTESNSCQTTAGNGAATWRFVASSSSAHWYTNKGNVDKVLMEAGDTCTVSYFSSGSFPLDK